MGKNPSRLKNIILYSALLLGIVTLLASYLLQRTEGGGLMASFYAEPEELPDMGRLHAWKSEEENLYYLFLPSACENGDRLRIGSAFPEFSLELERKSGEPQDGAEADGAEENEPKASESVSFQEDIRYTLKWKLLGWTVQEYEVMFVRSRNIPALCLRTEGGRPLAEEAVHKETYEQRCSLTLIDEEGKTLHALRDVKVGGRGNSTWEAAKKPLKLTLPEKEGLLSMAPAFRFNLIANAYDGSHMRNKLALDLANEVCRGFTADGEWTELYYNGEYEGLYLLTEKVEIAEGRIETVSLEEENERVNGGGIQKAEAFGFEKEYQGMTVKGVSLPHEPADLTGGYLLEMDLKSRYDQEASGVITKEGAVFTLESPGYASENEITYIAELLADVESAIYSEEGVSEISGKRLEELIDITSFADAYLMGEILGEQDTGISSQYFYKKPSKESGLLYAASVWDFDGSMGNTNPAMYAYPECLSISVEEVRGSATGISNKWFSALCRQQVFMERVKQRYEEVFHEKLQEVISVKIPAYAETIRKAALLDRLRWQEASGNWPFIWPEGYYVEEGEALTGGYQVYDRLDAQVAQISEFLTGKSAFLYDLWVNETKYHKVYVKPQAAFLSDTMFYGGYYWVREGECLPELPYYTSDWYPGEDYERKGFFLQETGEEVDVTAPVYEDMEIVDVWEKAGSQE